MLLFIYKSTYYWILLIWSENTDDLKPMCFPWRLSWLRHGPFRVKVNTSLVGYGSLALCMLISRAWFMNIASALSYLSENKSLITLVLSLISVLISLISLVMRSSSTILKINPTRIILVVTISMMDWGLSDSFPSIISTFFQIISVELVIFSRLTVATLNPSFRFSVVGVMNPG